MAALYYDPQALTRQGIKRGMLSSLFLCVCVCVLTLLRQVVASVDDPGAHVRAVLLCRPLICEQRSYGGNGSGQNISEVQTAIGVRHDLI